MRSNDSHERSSRPGGPRAGLSIRYSLPLVISALVATALVAFAAAAYIEVRESAVDAAAERLTSATRQISTMLGGGLATFAGQVSTQAADPALARFLRTSDPADSVAALAALPAAANIHGYELRDLALRRVLASSPDIPAGVEADPAIAEVLNRADGGAVGAMRPMRDSLAVPVAAVVTDGGRPAGYLVTWWRLSGTGQGDVERLVGTGARMYVINASGDLWTNLSSPVAPQPLPARTADTTAFVEYENADRQPWLAAIGPLASAPWDVVVAVPRHAVTTQARGMLRSFILLGLVALVLAAAATWALAGRFTAPILQLAGAAEAFSAGDYKQRSPVARRDEIGTLSRTFNGMADNVEAAHAALERKVSELAVLDAQHRDIGERLRQVLRSSPDVIYEMQTTSDRPSFTWISDNVERLLGAPAAQVMDPDWWPLHVHPDDVVPSVQPSRDFGPEGEAMREFRLLHTNGRYRWIRDRQRLTAGSGRLVGAWSDVTELRSLEEQFRQAQKLEAVGRLAGGIAHDFNNIVTVILGETEMALSTQPAHSPVRDSFDQVRAAAERAALLTRQLLTFSRKQLTETAVLDLNEAIRGVTGMLDRLIGEDLDLQFRLAAGIAPVTADPAQIEQVLLNLVINARDAMPDGGTVIIETRNVTLDADYVRSHADAVAGEHVALTVSDNGTGISPEAREHLFEPFFTTKGPGKGTGLGLATCYGIARQFGGHIGVYSEVGVGTTITLYLPATAGSVLHHAASPDTAATVATGTETILLVEDEAQVRAIVARILRAQGYTITAAANGADALEILERGDPVDLLLTDLVMPRMGGRELAERATLLRPKLRVLFTSGYTEDVIVQNRLLAHDIMLLNKPFTRVELAAKVREALDAALPSA